jgi:hypothetical protein
VSRFAISVSPFLVALPWVDGRRRRNSSAPVDDEAETAGGRLIALRPMSFGG